MFVQDLPVEAEALPAESIVTSSSVASSSIPDPSIAMAFETSHLTDLETSVEPPSEMPNPGFEETPKNVLPFRPVGEMKSPVLTPVENNAFDELARQLSARLDSEKNGAAAAPGFDPTRQRPSSISPRQPRRPRPRSNREWLVHPEPPARGETRRDKALLDLLPVGVLIYRLDRLLYANARVPRAHGLSEPARARRSRRSRRALCRTRRLERQQHLGHRHAGDDFAPPRLRRTRAGRRRPQAQLYTISWDDESALALIFSGAGAASTRGRRCDGRADRRPPSVPESAVGPGPSAVGHANAEELGAILDTTAEGIVMFDAEGNINSCNRSAEALFGYDGAELVQRNLSDLFAPESQRVVRDYLEGIKGAGVASLLDHGRDVLGRVRERRPDSAVDDDGTDAGRGAEFLRGVPRSVAGPKERERATAGAAAGRSRRQRQGRHAGADQPRGPHAAQRHHRLCRSDDRRTVRRARQRALRRIHEGHPRLRRARHRHHQRPARSVADRDRQARSRLRQPEPQRPGRATASR